VLRGLPPVARRVAVALLSTFERDTPSLSTVRSYALSCERVAALESGGDVRTLHRELRINLNLLKALDLR
jgi:hypothetical protein